MLIVKVALSIVSLVILKDREFCWNWTKLAAHAILNQEKADSWPAAYQVADRL